MKRFVVWVSAEGNTDWGYGQVQYPIRYPEQLRLQKCGPENSYYSWIHYCQDCAAEMGLVW